MGTKDSSSRGDDLESWITDLTGGEPTVRRLRQRLDAERVPDDDACPTCSGSTPGHPDHLPAQRTA